MRRVYRGLATKPPLGTFLAGSHLAMGLQIAAVCNESATDGPLQGGVTSPVIYLHNLLNRNHGKGSGTMGGSPPFSAWSPTHGYGGQNVIGFRNVNGAGGAVDFGPVSNYPTFSAITCLALCASSGSSIGSTRRVVLSYDGATDNFSIGQDAASNKWFGEILTAGGLQSLFIGPPTHPSDLKYVDFVGFTYDGATFRPYLNGIPQATTAVNSAIALVGTVHILLSGNLNASNANSDGNITAFYLWNRTLTAAQMQQLYVDPYWGLVPRPWRRGEFPPPVGPAPASALPIAIAVFS